MGFYRIIARHFRFFAATCGMIGMTILPVFLAYSQSAQSDQQQENTESRLQSTTSAPEQHENAPNIDTEQNQDDVQEQSNGHEDQPEIVERDGVYYKKGEETPFTGVLERRRKDGLPRLEERYEHGRIIRMRQWHPNGKLAEETAVSGDTWTLRLWNEDGILEQETNVVVKDKKKVSESSKLWHENGQLKLEIHFAGEKLDGVVREYAKDGTLIKHEIYSQGKLVTKIK
ncbi:toxin-antitoxin system YwqK family antitoxin [Desulfovibrio inopinatus]|uniref:toxin-antitoxin system YwqK family antitoxin n=1 Tax=Desulfovibrio inopinatus TaxID=102109 RepID=UPI000485B504|nr:hypothetical protein [Desulfovibrio inopinatus]